MRLRVKLTHLTHCCAWPGEGRSILHIERSWPAIRAAPTDRPMSSSTCCSQFLQRRHGGCFQLATGGVLVWASIDSCSACEAGVFSDRRQMWPNNEWRLSAIRNATSASFVLSLTTALDTLSYHLIPRIRRSACSWKDWILSLSTLRIVQVSYNTTDCTREVYILSLVERLSLCWRQTLSRWAVMEPAMPRRLCISG